MIQLANSMPTADAIREWEATTGTSAKKYEIVKCSTMPVQTLMMYYYTRTADTPPITYFILNICFVLLKILIIYKYNQLLPSKDASYSSQATE